MDTLNAIRVFIAVAETGSFTQAAHNLISSKAKISLAVQQLESLWRVRLFHRTTRRVQLTPDGETALLRCRSIVSEVDELQTKLRAEGGPLEGSLKVDVPSRFCRELLIPALPDFLALHPGLTLTLGATDRMIDLIQEGVDCVIRAGQNQDVHLVARPLGSLPQITCAAPSYLARYGVPETPQALSSHYAVGYITQREKLLIDPVFYVNEHFVSYSVASKVLVNSAESYFACALAGLGIIQVPRYSAAPHLAKGELIEILPQYAPPALPLHALYPHRRGLNRRVQIFLDWVESQILPHATQQPRAEIKSIPYELS